MSRPLYVFDLDGTLADAGHRVHHIRRPACPHCGWTKRCLHDEAEEQAALGNVSPIAGRPRFYPDWDAFNAACVDDGPMWPALTTLHLLYRAGAEVHIWTGRGEEVRAQTEAWLAARVRFPEVVGNLRMRPVGDRTEDHAMKSAWLDGTEVDFRRRLVGVFEDRSRVVAMWRDRGVACFQVAPGDF